MKFPPLRAFVSCLACQHFISDWLGKLKPNKLSKGCQNELKVVAVEKATNPRISGAPDKTAMLRRLDADTALNSKQATHKNVSKIHLLLSKLLTLFK